MIEFFQTLFKYRGILFYRTLASLRADARGLYLGYAWWLLEPVLSTALYYFIFGFLLNSKTPDFIGYLLLGTVTFQWFQAATTGSLGTIAARAHLYRQMPLPKYLFSLIGIFSTTWKFCCVFLVILGYIIFSTGVRVDWHLIWLPLIVIVQLLVVFGLSINLSIASAYFRDLQTFSSVVFRALMFLSAIFWDVEKVPESLVPFFYANPGASLIQLFRDVILYQRSPSFVLLFYLVVLGSGLIQVGILWNRRVDGHILKHVQA